MIPYVSDQLAMARIPRPTFALMLALLPAVAMIVGVLVLRQSPPSSRSQASRWSSRPSRCTGRRTPAAVHRWPAGAAASPRKGLPIRRGSTPLSVVAVL